MQLRIDPSNNQTIKNLLQDLPSNALTTRRFVSSTPKLSPTSMLSMPLIINSARESVSIVFEASINSRAHEHEGAMVDVYSRMNFNEALLLHVAVANRPDSLLLGHQGGSGRQRLPQVQGRQAQVRGPRGYRTCTGRHRHPRRRRRHPADAAATPATPATPPDGDTAAAGEEEPRSVPSPVQSGGQGRRAVAGSERAGKPSG